MCGCWGWCFVAKIMDSSGVFDVFCVMCICWAVVLIFSIVCDNKWQGKWHGDITFLDSARWFRRQHQLTSVIHLPFPWNGGNEGKSWEKGGSWWCPSRAPPLKNTRKFTFGSKATSFHTFLQTQRLNSTPKVGETNFYRSLSNGTGCFCLLLYIVCETTPSWPWYCFFSQSRARDKFIVSHSIIYGIDAQLVDVYGTCS